MVLFNLVNTISKPTRITTHSNTLLDPIIISDTMNYIYSDVFKIPSEISDHDASVSFIAWLYDKEDKQFFFRKTRNS